MRIDTRILSNVNQAVINNAKKGINAFIKSIKAFYGLENKCFIITNVFKTAQVYISNFPLLILTYLKILT